MQKSKVENVYRTFKAVYIDDNMSIYSCITDDEAIEEARKNEWEYGTLVNVYVIDENYDEIGIIY